MTAEFSIDDPRSNRLLGSLAEGNLAEIRRYLEYTNFPLGKVLCEPGERIRFAYFPHAGMVSLVAVLADGAEAEMAVLGRESVFGYASSLISRESFGRYVVQVGGCGSRIRSERLIELTETTPALRELLRRYIEALLAHSFQCIACNAVHDVEERCCRWLLTLHDRVDGDDLPVTHEFLAKMLGVQRSTISLTVRTFQIAGLIEQRRGGITITDRRGIEEIACECYLTIRRRYEMLLPRTYARI